MKYCKYIFICFFLFWCLQVGLCNCAYAQQSIAVSGKTTISQSLRKNIINVTFQTVKINRGHNIAALYYLPPDGFDACSIVVKLDISINGKKVFVPWSVFGDLIDPHGAYIEYKKGTYILSIGGGDASEAYHVKVYFNKRTVFRRIVYDLEFDDSMKLPVEDDHYWLREM